MRDHFIKRLTELAENDPRILLITGDLGFGVLDDFAKRFPEQYLNAGVAEQNMTGLAAGLALEGRVVFTYSIANFPILRCLEQIRNDACYHNANVKVVAIGGGFSYGSLGMSHHATEDLAIMRSLADITVLSPGDLWESLEATTALVNTPGTCYLRLDKSHAGMTNRPGEVFKIGQARQLRDGTDMTIVATGGILSVALKVADEMSAGGVRCRVLSAHSIKPFDENAIIAAAKETGGIITLEEHTLEGGLGSAVAETLLDQGVMPKYFHRMALRDGYSSIVGSQDYLRQRYHLDANALREAIQKGLGCQAKIA